MIILLLLKKILKLLADDSIVSADQNKPKAREQLGRYASIPMERRLEINAKRRADYQRKKQGKESRIENMSSSKDEDQAVIPGNIVNFASCASHEPKRYLPTVLIFVFYYSYRTRGR
jgi:hypothetical protein